jgi:hypothetical protein
MKLNISSEKLIRLMLTTNPTLARYKGSIAAIRLLLNTLGIKCSVLTNKHSINMKYEISGLPEGYNTTEVTAKIFGICYTNGKYIKPFIGETLLSVLNEDNIHVQGFNSLVEYKDDTTLSYSLTPFTENAIISWNNDPRVNQNDHILPLTVTERANYTIKAQTEFANILNKYLKNNYPNAKVTLAAAVPYLVADSSNISTEIVCLLTNISDKNAEPIKSILAKQLQEVLPINIVVTPENIIGCALDE